MRKWIGRIVMFGLLAGLGYQAWSYQKGGLFSLPDLPDGAYYISYKNGLRAIVLDADVPDRRNDASHWLLREISVADRDRKYLGVPLDVEPWFRDAWSWCKAPTEAERAELAAATDLAARFQNARFEAVCRINADGVEITRGLIFSVPRL